MAGEQDVDEPVPTLDVDVDPAESAGPVPQMVRTAAVAAGVAIVSLLAVALVGRVLDQGGDERAEEPGLVRPGPPAIDVDDAETFLSSLSLAAGAGRVDVLVAALHPDVLETYGPQQCRDHLQANLDAVAVTVDVEEVGDLGVWVWESERRPVIVPDVVEVTARTNDGTPVELHLASTATGLRWFSDCGEPSGG